MRSEIEQTVFKLYNCIRVIAIKCLWRIFIKIFFLISSNINNAHYGIITLTPLTCSY